MKINNEWQDYKVIATGDGEKLEKWGNVYLLRPDPQIIWRADKNLNNFSKLNAHYVRSKNGGGEWKMLKSAPKEWIMSWRNLKFSVKLMNFKHTGLFPEQAANWSFMIDKIKTANRPISVLNLFGYTGGATVACTSAGASVCHVDSARNMVQRCKQNMKLSGLENAKVRYITDDCKKFVEREIKRGNKYDAIIMDPPEYGRGPNGELWKMKEEIYKLVLLCTKVLSTKPLFFLINSYTTGLQPMAIYNILTKTLKNYNGSVSVDELCLPTEEGKVVLPCGAIGLWQANENKK